MRCRLAVVGRWAPAWGWIRDGYGHSMTRDEAIRTGIFSLARWHKRDHGERCRCLEGEKFGFQAAAVVDALAAEGMPFDGYAGADLGTFGAPRVGEG